MTGPVDLKQYLKMQTYEGPMSRINLTSIALRSSFSPLFNYYIVYQLSNTKNHQQFSLNITKVTPFSHIKASLSMFDLAIKSQGQSKVIISINLTILQHLMLNTKFQSHQSKHTNLHFLIQLSIYTHVPTFISTSTPKSLQLS